jgi:EAL domain-containing protein (putative c-di-GMP-specific phosphodiesterase class I)
MPAAEGVQTTESGVAVAAPEVASEAAYLDAMEQQLDAGGQAREHLLRALEEDHFILLEQRIEALTPEGQPNLREVLLRLQEETERTLPPAKFFEIAERYDLMGQIDRWVVRRLLRYAANMKRADTRWRMPLYCLNVSASTLRDRGFPNHVRSQLQHWDIAGSRLCFEIHHGSFADQQADIAYLMEQLKPLGCRFTVDGFGSHKVSFAPFMELRFDYLKIDGSIVSQVLRSPSELTKVKAMVLACRKIGVQTIAQFVEDDDTRQALKEAGVDYVQGFGIEKPGPLAVVAATAA